MIRAIALDDEPPALKLLQLFAKNTAGIQLDAIFTRPDEALSYLEENRVDLIFLDVEMPSMSGLEFYRRVPVHTHVVFTTAYMQYAVEGFNLNALDFLLKPYSQERFVQAVQKAAEALLLQQPSESEKYLYIRADYSIKKVAISDIVLVESLKDYVKFHFEGDRFLLTRMTLKHLAGLLEGTVFVRVHRSYMVPLDKITSVRNKVIFIGNKEIPVSASYEEDFLERFGRRK